MDLTRWNDGSEQELEQLVGGDLELLEVGRRVRAARPEPRIDPEFQRRLRAQLMTAAESQLRPRGLGRLLRPRASLFAYGAAGLGTAMIAAATLAYYAPHSDHYTVVDGQASINGHPSINPDDAITIEFNREMDRNAVVRGLVIQPATTWTPSWKGTTLTVTPDHHLQPNTPYVVTIPKNAARDLKGDVATKDITITFGTSPVAPASPTAPAGPVTLSPKDAGSVVTGSLLGFSGDGSLLASSGLLPAPTTASPGEATPAPVPALVRYASDGPVRLGDPVSAVALSPAGYQLATLTPTGDGVLAVVAVSGTDGSHRSVLSTHADAASPLGWGGDPTDPVVLFTSGGQLTSVDLEHHPHAVAAPQLAGGQTLALAPGGRYAFLGAPAPSSGAPATAAPNPAPGPGPLIPPVHLGGNGGAVAPGPSSDGSTNAAPFSPPDPGRLLDLQATATSASPPSLTGLAAGDVPTFSADGSRVGWVDHSVIDVQALNGSGPVLHVSPPTVAGDTIGSLGLDVSGDRVAYILTHGDGATELRVARVGGGLLAAATARGLSNPVFSPDGGSLAYLRHSGTDTVAELASVPGAPLGLSVPRAAKTAIDSLVNAEVTPGDHKGLDGVVAPAVKTDLLNHLPGGLSRGYVISAMPSATGDSVTAQIRLLRDPTNDHPTVAYTDQTAVLRRAGEAYIVTESDISSALHNEPNGPQVVQVDTRRVLGITTVRITFDSDLDPSSVTNSLITLTGSTGLVAPTVSYDATSRTVTITFLGRLHHAVGMSVGIGLRDVNGQGLAQPFTTTIGPTQ